MAYIGREGSIGLDVETDGHIGGKGFERDLVRDWDLDVDALQNHTRYSRSTKKPPKLVHNIIFSMPPGTSPRAVLRAVQRLALSKWALQHRYAMALHTDDEHPHVHVVLKAVSEQGMRLNIRKATLRSWRAQFAANLRDLGVNANATERAVRGQVMSPQRDGVYRANLREETTFASQRTVDSPEDRQSSRSMAEHNSKFRSTRQSVTMAWREMAEIAEKSGDVELAAEIRSFEGRMFHGDPQSPSPNLRVGSKGSMHTSRIVQ